MRVATRPTGHYFRLQASITRSGEVSKDHGMTFVWDVSLCMLLLTVFGTISPGRFYVSIVAKMVLSHLIMNYDIKLANPDASQSLAWSYALIPHPMTRLLIRAKAM